MVNAFSPLLELVRTEVESILAQLFSRKRAEAAGLGPSVLVVLDAIRDLTMRGGKRLRPALLYAAYHSVDEAAPDGPAFSAGAALELLQTYFLIHDDWMDRDEVRRGGPSVHVVLARHFGSQQLGDAAAVLAGDHAAALALEALASCEAPEPRICRAARAFARMQQDTIFGQQLDLVTLPEQVDIERMHDLKTGSYTVRGPIVLGATLAGASEELLAALERFAYPLGLAFQLRDDLLGTFGDAARTGKPTGNDIRAGKPTSLLAEAVRRLNDAQKAELGRVVGRSDASEQEVAGVMALLEQSGARAAVEARLEQLAAQARVALAGLDTTERARAWLGGAVDAIATRVH